MSEQTPTVGSLLQFDFEKPPDKEIDKLREYGGLVAGAFGTPAGLAQRYWQNAGANLFRTLGRTLDRPVTDFFAGGWNFYQPFLQYRDAKRYTPDVPVQEELLEHSIDATLSPSIKIVLNGNEVGEIKFQFAASLKLEGGTLTIQNGRFMSLRPGKCWATAAVRCYDKPLIERKTSELILPGELRFGDGIPIRPGGAHAAAKE